MGAAARSSRIKYSERHTHTDGRGGGRRPSVRPSLDVCECARVAHTAVAAQGGRHSRKEGRTGQGPRPRYRPSSAEKDCCRIWIVWRHARSSFQMRQDQSLGEAARSRPLPPIVSGNRQTATAASDLRWRQTRISWRERGQTRRQSSCPYLLSVMRSIGKCSPA